MDSGLHGPVGREPGRDFLCLAKRSRAINHELRFIIAASCSGVQFMLCEHGSAYLRLHTTDENRKEKDYLAWREAWYFPICLLFCQWYPYCISHISAASAGGYFGRRRVTDGTTSSYADWDCGLFYGAAAGLSGGGFYGGIVAGEVRRQRRRIKVGGTGILVFCHRTRHSVFERGPGKKQGMDLGNMRRL